MHLFLIQGDKPLNAMPTQDKVACWAWCASIKDCNWFTYETSGPQMCYLFENCPEISEERYPHYISGQKNCEYIFSMLPIIKIPIK